MPRKRPYQHHSALKFWISTIADCCCQNGWLVFQKWFSHNICFIAANVILCPRDWPSPSSNIERNFVQNAQQQSFHFVFSQASIENALDRFGELLLLSFFVSLPERKKGTFVVFAACDFIMSSTHSYIEEFRKSTGPKRYKWKEKKNNEKEKDIKWEREA